MEVEVSPDVPRRLEAGELAVVLVSLDDAITRALHTLGRSGVPVYAVYRPGQAPLVLSELPSVREVVEALNPPH